VNGGPDLVVATVEALTGITIDYWALTWFEGFEAMVNDVGGLNVNVPFDVFDSYAHAQIEAGTQVLDGREALAFARTRHALPSGDFGRSENQGRLMVAALTQFRREFSKDPSRLLIWVAALLRSAETDVPLDQLMTLAFTGTTLNPKRITNIVLPGGNAMVGGTSVVMLDQTALETISREAKRASRIVGKLLAFGRQGQPERMPSDVNQALRDTIDLRRYALRMQEIKLSVSLMQDPPLVLADPFQLQQVFINLLSNAEQAVSHQPGDRNISVKTEVRGECFVVTISDSGPGIAPEALPHIFNPFFTTKPRGAGTGLGLSISDGIIREHRGVLRTKSEPGHGATFEVELPLTPAT